MILFFFLLLMLAMAWGVADHFHELATKTPPPERAPQRIEAPAPPSPTIAPPAIANEDPPADPKPVEEPLPEEAAKPPPGSADSAAERS